MIHWCVKAGWGYIVEAWQGGMLLEHYEAGDCWIDSTTFGTGQMPDSVLHEICAYTVELMGEQYKITESQEDKTLCQNSEI